MDDADPARIHTLSDLKRELDLLRRAEGRQEGKHQLSLDDTVKRLREHRREVPRSTLGNYLSGRTLAPQSVFDDILRALGVDTAAQGTWADAWERLDDARREPTSTDEQEPAPVAGQEPAPTAPVPASRRLKWIMTLERLPSSRAAWSPPSSLSQPQRPRSTRPRPRTHQSPANAPMNSDTPRSRYARHPASTTTSAVR